MTRTTAPLMVEALALFLVLPANAQDHDNSAFIELKILSLPDLTISASAQKVTPSP